MESTERNLEICRVDYWLEDGECIVVSTKLHDLVILPKTSYIYKDKEHVYRIIGKQYILF